MTQLEIKAYIKDWAVALSMDTVSMAVALVGVLWPLMDLAHSVQTQPVYTKSQTSVGLFHPNIFQLLYKNICLRNCYNCESMEKNAKPLDST